MLVLAFAAALGAAVPAPAPAPQAAAPNLVWPLCGKIVGRYGYRIDPFTGRPMFHAGLDLGAASNREVRAAAAGTVLKVANTSIELDHGGGARTRYFYLSGIAVEPGDRVGAGARLAAAAGSHDPADAPHLHFEMRYGDKAVDPLKYLPAATCP